jgi:hypothetical protein
MENRNDFVYYLGDVDFDSLDDLERVLLTRVFVWIMWNEETQEWEQVGTIFIPHPLLSAIISANLEIGKEELALAIVATGLSMKYRIPNWLDDNDNVRDIWKKSRIVKFMECPEEVKGKISKFVREGLGVKEDGIPFFII